MSVLSFVYVYVFVCLFVLVFSESETTTEGGVHTTYTSESEDDKLHSSNPDTILALPSFDFSGLGENFSRRFERKSWRERHEHQKKLIKQRFEVRDDSFLPTQFSVYLINHRLDFIHTKKLMTSMFKFCVCMWGKSLHVGECFFLWLELLEHNLNCLRFVDSCPPAKT